MIDNGGPHLEENVARLIAAAAGPDARPTPALRAQTLARLRDTLHARREAAPFPDGIAMLLGALLVLAVCSLVALAAAGSLGSPGSPAWFLLATGPVANLALLPLAAAVIVLRRKRERQTD